MNLERRIIIGLITSTEFLQQIHSVWNANLLESQMAKRLAGWCTDYFEKYHKAPGRNIEGIYLEKLKAGLPKDIAEEIEEDILPGLSEEYEQEQFNLSYLLDQTRVFLKERNLIHHAERIQELLDTGELLEAEKLALDYKPVVSGGGADIDLSNATVLQRVDKAFSEAAKPVVRFPGALGIFWNSQLVRGGFVALMASDKRGKSYWLLEIAIRGRKQGSQVAFFQAGDMTEGQQLKRICVYLTKRSDMKKYSGEMWQPVKDCVRNQLDVCDKECRECDFGVFENRTEKEVREQITLTELKRLLKDNPDYHPCYNCEEYDHLPIGSGWIERVDTGEPLTVEEAKEAVEAFFIQNKRRFKLSTHANGTLTIKEIKALLDVWEREDGFVPDIIAIDYADLLVPESRTEFRHQVDEIWKGLRNLSQERHCLVVTATQADAKSYEQNRLKVSNFSEDKRKNSHVTAMYGLNQDPQDREKQLGWMRINEIVIREGDFSNSNEVYVLQNLRRGRPFLGSFW